MRTGEWMGWKAGNDWGWSSNNDSGWSSNNDDGRDENNTQEEQPNNSTVTDPVKMEGEEQNDTESANDAQEEEVDVTVVEPLDAATDSLDIEGLAATIPSAPNRRRPHFPECRSR